MTALASARARPNAVRSIVGLAGALYTLSGLGLLLAPVWFFERVGPFAPFNRHYEGDVGAFILPLGVALLWAVRRPAGHRPLIALTAVASLLHALNHAYDAWIGHPGSAGWLLDVAPLALLAVLLLWAWRQTG